MRSFILDILVLMIVLFAIIAGLFTGFLSKKPDSAIEQISEKILEDQTGLEIDFSGYRKDEKEDEA